MLIFPTLYCPRRALFVVYTQKQFLATDTRRPASSENRFPEYAASALLRFSVILSFGIRCVCWQVSTFLTGQPTPWGWRGLPRTWLAQKTSSSPALCGPTATFAATLVACLCSLDFFLSKCSSGLPSWWIWKPFPHVSWKIIPKLSGIHLLCCSKLTFSIEPSHLESGVLISVFKAFVFPR